MATAAAETLVVTDGFVANINGVDTAFRKGETIASDHPAVKKWPQFFGKQDISQRIEQATAAPGEKRGAK
jgi:hypothetical protein